ncbi:MAG: transposase [Coriobacteriales bacterium]|nr:transposase [Coriobacteriales bacterium]
MSERGKSHKAYPPDFKSKCVRELLDGDETLSQVASRNGIAPSLLSKWKSQVLENMDAVLGAEAEHRREAEAERARQEEVDNLNRIIGQLTVERDYLQREVRKAVGTWKG